MEDPANTREHKAASQALESLARKARDIPWSRHAKMFLTFDKDRLLYFPLVLARAGIKSFRPDFFGSPVSPYNALLETIAITTFQNLARAHTYSSMTIDMARIDDYMFLSKLYRNFTWSCLVDQARKEARIPGSVSKLVEDRNSYKRRKSVRSR